MRRVLSGLIVIAAIGEWLRSIDADRWTHMPEKRAGKEKWNEFVSELLGYTALRQVA